ncbi:hypothetical protein [Burkholderia sp. Bp8963]|uniref:hypothetical protein n=1 Tax=Burkholderia sp. Bp8963 TaxID=2184547 RepID=UPI000F5A89CF|nr:hypothetical protein [Burkholderia sp. Bp8963]
MFSMSCRAADSLAERVFSNCSTSMHLLIARRVATTVDRSYSCPIAVRCVCIRVALGAEANKPDTTLDTAHTYLDGTACGLPHIFLQFAADRPAARVPHACGVPVAESTIATLRKRKCQSGRQHHAGCVTGQRRDVSSMERDSAACAPRIARTGRAGLALDRRASIIASSLDVCDACVARQSAGGAGPDASRPLTRARRPAVQHRRRGPCAVRRHRAGVEQEPGAIQRHNPEAPPRQRQNLHIPYDDSLIVSFEQVTFYDTEPNFHPDRPARRERRRTIPAAKRLAERLSE